MLKLSEPPRCGDCGMELTSWTELHTVVACEIFKLTGYEDVVREAMHRAALTEESEPADGY